MTVIAFFCKSINQLRNRSRIDHNLLDYGSSITDRKVVKESFVKHYIDLLGTMMSIMALLGFLS